MVMKELDQATNEYGHAMLAAAPPAEFQKLDYQVYKEKDLISFGNFLLNRYGVKVQLGNGMADVGVTDAALESWKEQQVVAVTDGMKLVGYDFNPSKNPYVDAVKYFAAKMFDYMHLALTGRYKGYFLSNIVDAAAMAILSAQMMVVKAITWRD